MKRLRTLIAAIALLAGGAGYFLHRDPAVDEKALLAELAPAVAFSDKGGTPPHYRSEQGIAAFNSYDAVPHIHGYAGPLKVLLTLGQEGRIRGIRIIEHRETKNYVHYMESPAYLARFVGKSVSDRFEIDRDLDGISRATESVEALAKTVRESSRAVAKSAFGIETRPEAGGTGPRASWSVYLVLFLLAAGGYAATRRSRRPRLLRDGILAAGIVVIGLYLSSPFSILHAYQLLLLQTSSSALWHVIVISTLLSVAFAGRFYCGWLCPFGALSELIGRVPVRKWAVPQALDDRWRNLKYLLFGGTLAAVLAGRRVEYGNYEAYITLFSLHGTTLAWALVVSSLLANLRVERFWCRYLCPVAALTGLLCRRDPAYVSRQDCPMGNKPDPETSECIRCNRCLLPAAARKE